MSGLGEDPPGPLARRSIRIPIRRRTCAVLVFHFHLYPEPSRSDINPDLSFDIILVRYDQSDVPRQDVPVSACISRQTPSAALCMACLSFQRPVCHVTSTDPRVAHCGLRMTTANKPYPSIAHPTHKIEIQKDSPVATRRQGCRSKKAHRPSGPPRFKAPLGPVVVGQFFGVMWRAAPCQDRLFGGVKDVRQTASPNSDMISEMLVSKETVRPTKYAATRG